MHNENRGCGAAPPSLMEPGDENMKDRRIVTAAKEKACPGKKGNARRDFVCKSNPARRNSTDLN